MSRSSDARGSEDTSESREHVENAAENRDALAAQARRTQETAPASTDTPVNAGAGRTAGSEDDTDNVEAVHEAEENRDALAEQNRRVAATAPDDVNMTGPDDGDRR